MSAEKGIGVLGQESSLGWSVLAPISRVAYNTGVFGFKKYKIKDIKVCEREPLYL